ncbi:protein flp [Plakobranchus ocellatus]|uniref:Protein flp n=1 Tax=Plakobranchus ocellatus TaxID=259542 RepID=A0AAV3XVC6_9GAST|nr:protein flp [Plakobranchus ocellatus]
MQVFSPWQQEFVETMAREVMNCGRMPGMSLSVVRGSDSWTLPLGVADIAMKKPVTNLTRFAIGSLTKAFTSTLLVSLLAQSPNNWTLDTPLAMVLGNPNIFSDKVRSQQATIKDILSHRLGLARADLALFAGYPVGHSLSDVVRIQESFRQTSYLFVGKLTGYSLSDDVTEEESFRQTPYLFVGQLTEQRPFRDGYVYSNLLYSLAGHVIEKLCNQSYSQTLNSHLLSPLGMTSTGRYQPHGKDSRIHSSTRKGQEDEYLATPYLIVKDQLVPADPSLFSQEPFLPALGLASNSADMVRWLQVQLGRGVYPPSRVRVLPEGVVAATHEPVTPHIINNLRPRFPQPDLTFAYGLGWQQAVYKGFRRSWHFGSLFGFVSQIWLIPDLGFGLFVAVNGPARSPETQNKLTALLYFITDLLLGDRPWIDKESACSYPLPFAANGLEPTASRLRPSSEWRSRDDSRQQRSHLPSTTPTEAFHASEPILPKVAVAGDRYASSSSPSVSQPSLSSKLPEKSPSSSSLFSLPSDSSSKSRVPRQGSTSSILSSSPTSLSLSSSSSSQTKKGSDSAEVSISLSSLLSSRVWPKLTPSSNRSSNKNETSVSTHIRDSSLNLLCNTVLQDPDIDSFNLTRYAGFYYNKLFGGVHVMYKSTNVSGMITASTDKRTAHESKNATKDKMVPKHVSKLQAPVLTQKGTLRKGAENGPCHESKETNTDLPYLDTHLRILFGERFAGNLVYRSGNHKLLEPSENSVHTFHMIPTGIFEFSAYTKSPNEVTKMPVEFTEFDADGIPYLLRAVWQKDEILEFGRGWTKNHCVSVFKDNKQVRNRSASLVPEFVLFINPSSGLILNDCAFCLYFSSSVVFRFAQGLDKQFGLEKVLEVLLDSFADYCSWF